MPIICLAHLSGGEQQRVCIARALINDPKIVLADEPTGNLDAVNEEIVLRLLRELHRQGRTIVMVTHDPVVARLADRRIELHHGKIADQEVFAMADEEQFDEVLEELWAVEEHGEIAEIERLEVHGALPVSIAVEKMAALGLLTTKPHPPEAHNHKPFVNPCHDALKPSGVSTGDGSMIVEFTPRGRHAPPTSSAAIAWPSASLLTAWRSTANQKSSSRPASSNTSSRPKPRTKSAPSSATRAPARMARPSRLVPAARATRLPENMKRSRPGASSKLPTAQTDGAPFISRSWRNEWGSVLLNLLPNHILIIPTVNHGIDLAVISPPEQTPPFRAFAKENVA